MGLFASLRKFTLEVRPIESMDEHCIDQAMAQSMSALLPLEWLSLNGPTGNLTLHAVLTHGSKLKVLFLRSLVLETHYVQLLP
jgi:hypothetical protein